MNPLSKYYPSAFLLICDVATCISIIHMCISSHHPLCWTDFLVEIDVYTIQEIQSGRKTPVPRTHQSFPSSHHPLPMSSRVDEWNFCNAISWRNWFCPILCSSKSDTLSENSFHEWRSLTGRNTVVDVFITSQSVDISCKLLWNSTNFVGKLDYNISTKSFYISIFAHNLVWLWTEYFFNIFLYSYIILFFSVKQSSCLIFFSFLCYLPKNTVI